MFKRVNTTYLQQLDKSYKTGFSFIEEEEPEKSVNEWISEVTNNKIEKLYGMKINGLQ